MPTPREQAIAAINAGQSVYVNKVQYFKVADLPNDAAFNNEVRTTGNELLASIKDKTLKRGTRTQITPATQPSTTSNLILAANALRIEALIYNNGTQTVYLGKDNTVTTAVFMIAVPVNGTFIDDASNGAWFGITAAGVANIQGYEVA